MRILLWHGYLLGGTGSNVYTRSLAREWARAGHDVTVFSQEPHPELYDLGGADAVRPDVGGLLPVFVLDRYEGYEVKRVQDCSRAELERMGRAERGCAARAASGRARLLQPRPPRRAGGRGERGALRRQGPRLRARVLHARQRGARRLGAGGAGRRRGDVRRLGAYPRGPGGRRRPRRARARGAAGRGRRGVASAPARGGARGTARGGAHAIHRIPATRTSACPTRGTPSGSPTFLAGDEPTVVYFGKLLYNKGVHVLLEALREVDARAVDRRLRRLPRRARGAGGPARALHRPARAPPPRPLARARGRHGRASIFPEAFGMVAAEAAAAGSPPLVARHSGLAEIAEGLEQEYPPALRHLASFDHRRRRGARREAARAAGARRRGSRRRARGRARRRGRRAGAGRESPAVCSNPSTTFTRMGDEQRLGYEELLAAAREGFDAGTDFTVAVEEEFALLDPLTLGLVNRFEEVQAAAQGTPLEPHLVGELIASEVEIKTGRCETFADVPAAMAERRAQLQALVDPMGIALGATGTHPWSPLAGAADHRHAALPPQRRAAAVRRLAEQHLRHARARRDPRTPTGRSRSRTGCATCSRSCSRCPPARPSSRT